MRTEFWDKSVVLEEVKCKKNFKCLVKMMAIKPQET